MSTATRQWIFSEEREFTPIKVIIPALKQKLLLQAALAAGFSRQYDGSSYFTPVGHPTLTPPHRAMPMLKDVVPLGLRHVEVWLVYYAACASYFLYDALYRLGFNTSRSGDCEISCTAIQPSSFQ